MTMGNLTTYKRTHTHTSSHQKQLQYVLTSTVFSNFCWTTSLIETITAVPSWRTVSAVQIYGIFLRSYFTSLVFGRWSLMVTICLQTISFHLEWSYADLYSSWTGAPVNSCMKSLHLVTGRPRNFSPSTLLSIIIFSRQHSTNYN